MLFRYRIFGVVREAESSRPLEGLLVRAFDRDLLFDDALGSTLTGANGRFEIQFTELRFKELFEGRPDLTSASSMPLARARSTRPAIA